MHLDQTIRLLNPFSRLQLRLPSVLSFEDQLYGLDPDYYRDHFVWKIVLSSPPDDADAGYCIAVALHFYKKLLAFVKPGDASWTTLRVAGHRSPGLGFLGVQDMIFYKKKLYAIILTQTLTQGSSGLEDVKYLVECSGDLLLVIKSIDIITRDVEEIKDAAMKFTQLNSLGEYSLFLGFNTSVSLRAADYYGFLRRNCIYFTDDYCHGYYGTGTEGGHDMGVFDLEDNSITPHFKGLSTSLYSPPVWIVPT